MTGLVIGLIVVGVVIAIIAIGQHKNNEFVENLPNNNEEVTPAIKQPEEINGSYGFKTEESFFKYGEEILKKLVDDKEVDAITEINPGALQAIIGSKTSWEDLPKEEYTQDIAALLTTNQYVAAKGKVKQAAANDKVYVYVLCRYGKDSIICSPL